MILPKLSYCTPRLHYAIPTVMTSVLSFGIMRGTNFFNLESKCELSAPGSFSASSDECVYSEFSSFMTSLRSSTAPMAYMSAWVYLPIWERIVQRLIYEPDRSAALDYLCSYSNAFNI